MSRYYEIAVTPPKGGAPIIWTSHPKGKYDPGALNVQFDVLTAPLDVPLGNSTVTIDGVSLNYLFQSKPFAEYGITIKGGMQAGLPLVNPSQAGLLISGAVLQSFGNWQSTDMNLNFVLSAGGNTLSNPGNFVFNWKPGQSIADAIKTMIQTALPTFPAPLVKVNGAYFTSAPICHIIPTFGKMAQFIKSLTSYPGSDGISILILNNGTPVVYDTTTQPSFVQIDFADLIGQPKWVDQNIMQFTTVMRADIQVNSFVKMPPGLPYAPGVVTTAPNTNPLNQLKYSTSFQGKFVIQSVRHIGNFRDPDGSSWATLFQAAVFE